MLVSVPAVNVSLLSAAVALYVDATTLTGSTLSFNTNAVLALMPLASNDDVIL